jgi:DNA-binding transcriptional ArsR family regulator
MTTQRVTPTASAPMSGQGCKGERVSRLDETFSALADPTRRAVVDLLRKKPRRAGELSTALSMSPPAMSRHLRVLRQTGLVEEEVVEDDARVRMYSLRRDRFAEMRSWLDEVEAFWGDQLSAFKAHAERTRGRGGRAP